MRRVADIALIALLSIACIVFGALTLTSRETVSVSEKRSLTPMPKLHRKTLAALPTQFEQFFSDHLFVRNQLVKLRNYTKYLVWHNSGNDRVLVGKNGWLYLAWDGSVGVARRETLFTDEELKAWSDVLKQRTKWCADRGITYVFVVAPDKPSIYPEFVPNVLKPMRDRSKLEQLSAYLRNQAGINFVNLTEPLLQQKGIADLYLKTDTHWNQRGAYIGYQNIVQSIAKLYPSMQNLSIAVANFAQSEYGEGDCARMMGLRNCLLERVPVLSKLAENAIPTILPRAMIFHDSFGDGLKPYLEKHFAESRWVRQGNPTCDAFLVEQFKPKIVIQECIERHVVQMPPSYMQDWGSWLIGAVGHHEPKMQYLMVFPNTHEMNVARIRSYLEGTNVSPCGVREWGDQGEKVSFEEQKAQYADWYLLKTGDQGFKLADSHSERMYDKWQEYVRSGKHFKLESELDLVDGSKLQLYKRR